MRSCRRSSVCRACRSRTNRARSFAARPSASPTKLPKRSTDRIGPVPHGIGTRAEPRDARQVEQWAKFQEFTPMIPYEVDPSLHPAEPATDTLVDGFSPPPGADAPLAPEPAITTGNPPPV